MLKEFEIKDILKAVNTIYKTERKKPETQDKENIYIDKNDVLLESSQVKYTKREILVLDQMIE